MSQSQSQYHVTHQKYNIIYYKRNNNFIVMNLFLRVGNKNNSCIREIQENSIEFLRQSSLPYIL